jgi:integrase
MDWVKDSIQTGLYRRSREAGDVWAVKARIKGGKPITHTIGKASLFSAQDARVEARRVLTLLAQGINPAEERRQQIVVEEARSLTLEKAIEAYAAIATWKEKTRDDALSTLKRRFPDWLPRPLASITKEQCQVRFLKIKADVARLKTKRDKTRSDAGLSIKEYNNEIGLGEAQRSFRYLSAIFSSYIQDDAGAEKLLPKGNPCLILKAKKLRRVLQPRERFLDSSQRSKIYDAFSMNAQYPELANNITTDDTDLIWLLMHTGLRLDEALTMKWSAVDFTSESFTAFDTKNHRDHTLPMTNATKTMFARRHASRKSKTYVFPSPLDQSKKESNKVNKKEERPMSASRTFQRVSAEVGFEFTAHDLRRTVATVASEIGYDLNTIGSVLNHAKKGVTAGYVQHTQARLKRILEDIQDALFSMPYERKSLPADESGMAEQ